MSVDIRAIAAPVMAFPDLPARVSPMASTTSETIISIMAPASQSVRSGPDSLAST
jgi:hypothetical protein